MTFLKSTLLVGVVLAPPFSLASDAPGPGLDVTANRPVADIVRAPIGAEAANGRIASLFVLLGQDDVFARNCAACHGEKGRGDGVAASAFNPRPTDFTDREVMSKYTDDQLGEIIRNGNGAMPAFGSVLSEEDVDEVLSFIRSLIPDEEGAGS